MPSLLTSVRTVSPAASVPDTPAGLWVSRFPTPELVTAAAGMFHGLPIQRHTHGVTLHSVAKGIELHGERLVDRLARTDAALEGPQWRIVVSPGSVSVRHTDPARAERYAEAQRQSDTDPDQVAYRIELAGRAAGGAPIVAWSRKSRARMQEKIQQLDWSSVVDGTRPPVMLTLTYPGDWLAVAPDAAAATAHVKAFASRYRREYGVRIRCVWKREFQERGAPHYHFLVVPPAGAGKSGLTFTEWVSTAWASVVGSQTCGSHSEDRSCCERARHLAAGTGIDYVAGAECTDPRRIAGYFAKHGAFAEKEYQNHAPAEWIESGRVGRFWGVWGIDTATAGVYVEPQEAIAAARTLRRYSRANAPVIAVQDWAYRTVTDPDTGEVSARWRRKTRRRRLYHVRDGRSGFLRAKNGPAVAAQVARHLDRLYRPDSVVGRSGAGPLGYLP